LGRFFDNLVRRKRSVDGEVFAGVIRISVWAAP
jgi:hypothetical protein